MTRGTCAGSLVDLVVKVGGKCLEDGASLAAFAREVAAARREGVRLALVHGGGASLDARLARLGIATERREGLRLTPPAVMEEALAAFAGIENKRLVAALAGAGVPAVGLCGADGGTLRAERWRPAGFDPGRVGRVVGGDPRAVAALLEAGFVPVLAPVALGGDGEFLNLNADEAAAGLARVLAAPLLALLSDVPAVLDARGARIERLEAASTGALVDSGTIAGGMVPKVRSALEAASLAGARVSIASWKEPSVLRRLAGGERLGTTVEGKA
ncbi:MAG TPA: acetylglutamate kinase [Planctomycetota bacterium]|jgi:acetylglutamate kinase|nr:acetylglutamate kinase [Planctomycetota bacterium]